MKKFWSKFITLTMVVAILSTCLVGLVACGPKKPDAPADPVANSKCVNIDINPNIDLVVDSNNKVISVVANNEDAEALLVNAKVIGKSADEAVNEIVSLSVSMEYLTKDNDDVKILAVNASGAIDTTLAKELGDKAVASAKATVAKLQAEGKQIADFTAKAVTEVTNSVNRRLELAKAEIKANGDAAAKKAAEELTAAKLLLMETIEEISNGAITLVKSVKMDVVELNRYIYNLSQDIKVATKNAVEDIQFVAQGIVSEIDAKSAEIIAAAQTELANLYSEFDKIIPKTKAEAIVSAKNAYVKAQAKFIEAINNANKAIQNTKVAMKTAPNSDIYQSKLQKSVEELALKYFNANTPEVDSFKKVCIDRQLNRPTYASVIKAVEKVMDGDFDRDSLTADGLDTVAMGVRLAGFENEYSDEISKATKAANNALELAQDLTFSAMGIFVDGTNVFNAIVGLPNLDKPTEKFTTLNDLVSFLSNILTNQNQNVEVAFADYVEKNFSDEDKQKMEVHNARIAELELEIKNAKAQASESIKKELDKIITPQTVA